LNSASRATCASSAWMRGSFCVDDKQPSSLTKLRPSCFSAEPFYCKDHLLSALPISARARHTSSRPRTPARLGLKVRCQSLRVPLGAKDAASKKSEAVISPLEGTQPLQGPSPRFCRSRLTFWRVERLSHQSKRARLKHRRLFRASKNGAGSTARYPPRIVPRSSAVGRDQPRPSAAPNSDS
jgi:hypothetical protein